MIKPIDNSISMTRASSFNPAFCAAPTIYENTKSYTPTGQKLNINCEGCKKPRNVGQKLDYIV